MGNVKYLIKSSDNPATIYIRFYHGRTIDFIKSTSLLINPKYWNNKRGKVKQIAEFADKKNLQNKLNELESYLLNDFNDTYADGGAINSGWFTSKIKIFFDQDYTDDFTYFLDFAEHFFDTLPHRVQRSGQVGVAENTLKRYRTVINKLGEFEKYRKRRLKIGDIDLEFYHDFKDFLHKTQKLNYNTTGRYLSYVKTICIEARRHGLMVSTDIEKQEFRQTREDTQFVILDETEIQRIFEQNFSNKPYLDHARDWLIIGLWTGARVSDLLSFNTLNLTGDFLEYTSQKTRRKVVIPFHPQVRYTLKKREGVFPHPISSQRFNDYIKKVCKQVGIDQRLEGTKKVEISKNVWRKQTGIYEKWELVSSHICRRSFATNHYGKLSTPVIMSITGHSTEKMFLKYIGKTAKDNAEILMDYWKKLYPSIS